MDKNTFGTAITLANATELACAIILEVCGNDIGSTIDGKEISKETIEDMVLSQITRTAEKNYAV